MDRVGQTIAFRGLSFPAKTTMASRVGRVTDDKDDRLSHL